jgi:hypothetical protein
MGVMQDCSSCQLQYLPQNYAQSPTLCNDNQALLELHRKQAISSTSPYFLLTGTMELRSASVGACKLTASCAVHLLAQNLRIAGTSPTVETVILFLLK